MNEIEAFDNEWKNGNRDKARLLAKEYVEANKDQLAQRFGHLNIPQLVEVVSAYRNLGLEEDRIAADMWLLTKFSPQKIRGEVTMGAVNRAAIRGKDRVNG